jgi:presenilin enhancer 2
MDLTSPKVTDEEKVDLCRRYFFLGFALLPFLWAVNAVWFFREAFLRPAFPGQKKLRGLVIASALLAAASIAGLVFWFVLFLTHRAQWGATADALSFNIPTGSP